MRILFGLQLQEHCDASVRGTDSQIRCLSSKVAFTYGIYSTSGFRKERLAEFKIEASRGESPERVLEMIDIILSEGELSHFSIRNKEAFMKRLIKWVNRYFPEME